MASLQEGSWVARWMRSGKGDGGGEAVVRDVEEDGVARLGEPVIEVGGEALLGAAVREEDLVRTGGDGGGGGGGRLMGCSHGWLRDLRWLG